MDYDFKREYYQKKYYQAMIELAKLKIKYEPNGNNNINLDLLNKFTLLLNNMKLIRIDDSALIFYKSLTYAEKRIFKFIIEGKNGKQIAELSNLSINTVKKHIGSILSKFYCKNRYELIAKYQNKIKS